MSEIQTHTDPRLTITLTTRDADEGLRGEAIQRFVPSREWLLRMADLEDGCCISAGGWVAKVKAAEREDAARHEKVVRLVMAARYAVGVCDEEIWNSENGGTVKANQAIHGLHVALKEFDDIEATPTQTEAEREDELINALETANDGLAERNEIIARLRRQLDKRDKEIAEVERLRRTVDERDSRIADLHVSLDAARLDAKRLERVLADLRVKLDALVGAVGQLAKITPFEQRLSVSAARYDDLMRAAVSATCKPTEAP